MGWLSNDIIIVAGVGILGYLIYRKDYGRALVATALCYTILPVIRFKESGVNSAYAVSAVLALWICYLALKKEIKFSKKVCIFLGADLLSIVVILVAWLLQGNYELTHLIHFASMLQFCCGVVGVAILYDLVEKEHFQAYFSKALLVIAGWNFLMTLIQMYLPKVGLCITESLYTYKGKDTPLKAMEEAGRFLRAFGASYSATCTGVLCLIIAAFFIVRILRKKKSLASIIALLMILFTGLFAFSKTVILGIFISYVAAILFESIFEKRIYLSKSIKILACIVGSFLLVGVLATSIGLNGQVRYYYGKLAEPLSSLETRYGAKPEVNVESKDPGETDEKESQPEAGNLEKTMEIVRQNFWIGVGPAPIDGEFIGDSQYIVSLHDGGIVNAAIYVILYLFLFINAWKYKKTVSMLFVLVFAIGGLSIPVFASGFMIPFIAYVLCSHPEKENCEVIIVE